MTFQPAEKQELFIDNICYHIAEHPTAPGMPYGQEGRRAVVYQLIAEGGSKHALKVFKSRFRVPRMVAVSEKLEPYATFPGMQACERTVLTGSRHTSLLRAYPDLAYAVLMPWVEGPTWQEILLSGDEVSPARSLRLAHSFAKVLMALEERGVAHCDISGPNTIVQPGDQIALVDLEEMCGPSFLQPKEIPAGSPGYAHKSAPQGLWTDDSDRFSGAVLLAEMLCWCDARVRGAAWGESFFAPKDMQGENDRYDILHTILGGLYGDRLAILFAQAWRSDSLRDCPTFTEWAVALPERVSTPSVSQQSVELDSSRDALSLVLRAQRTADSGDMETSLSLYRQAIVFASPDLSGEIEARIDELEERLEKQAAAKEQDWECPDCGRQVPAGHDICLYCEEDQRQPEMDTFNEKKSGMPKWIFGVVLLCAASIIMAIWSLVSMGQRGFGPLALLATDTPTTTPAPTNTPNPMLMIRYSKVGEMPMVYIPAGEFLMGSTEHDTYANSDEFPQHNVYLDAYWIDQIEVSNAMFAKFLNREGNREEWGDTWLNIASEDVEIEKNHGEWLPKSGYEDHPVVEITWFGAQAYCLWAGRRLPTEAEWEKAAHGEDGRIYPWGDEFDCSKGNFDGDDCDGYNRTAPVGSFPAGASPYNVLDMAGNVGEWVADWYTEDYYEKSPYENPTGPDTGDIRVLRGESYVADKSSVHTARRGGSLPNVARHGRGFRCALDATP